MGGLKGKGEKVSVGWDLHPCIIHHALHQTNTHIHASGHMYSCFLVLLFFFSAYTAEEVYLAEGIPSVPLYIQRIVENLMSACLLSFITPRSPFFPLPCKLHIHLKNMQITTTVLCKRIIPLCIESLFSSQKLRRYFYRSYKGTVSLR